VGRLGWKKNTLSDLPPTPVLLARAEVLATEVIRHLHLVPKDHAWHLSSPTHAHSLSSSSPTSCARHTHRVETCCALNMGCLSRSGRRTRQRSAPASRKSACSPPASSLSLEPARLRRASMAKCARPGGVVALGEWGEGRALKNADRRVAISHQSAVKSRRSGAAAETLPPACSAAAEQPVKGAEVEAFTNAGRHPCAPTASRPT